MLHHFIAFQRPEGPLVEGSHEPGLVLLSILVSIAMSLLALQTSYVARRATAPAYRRLAMLTGACALGGGIWAMHFIGMLAFDLPAEVKYDTKWTLVSIVPAVLASWLALLQLSRSKLTFGAIARSGTLVGGGIGLMHYVGMAAMQTPLYMYHELWLFVLSIVAAVLLAILALWVRLGLRRTRWSSKLRFYLAGIIMGLAIVSMHYIAMYGVRFYGEAGEVPEGILVNNVYLALALSFVVVTLGMMVLSVNGLVRTRELHRQANQAQSRLQAIVDTAVDAIMTIDGEGTVRDFNRSAEKLFGYSAVEVLGRNVKMLLPETYHSAHDDYMEHHRRTGEALDIGKMREIEARRKDGSVFPIRLSAGKVELANRESLFVSLIADISDRVKLEASLRDAAERAEQAARAKGQFLANMSHEIRTPMNSIIGFTELLLQSELTSVQRSHLTNVNQSSRTLLGLINDILDTTKLESMKFDLELADFSLRSVAMQVESALRIQAKARELDFVTDYPDQMPDYFIGDALRLVQVLTNLVGNAVKFTERGGVSTSYAYNDGRVRIAIRDTGIGMSEQQLASVFEPFSQADASISRRFGGTGLGTTIARQLVEAMNGTIEVSSEVGQGTEFVLSLPLALGKAPKVETTVERVKLPPLDILIADDIEQNLKLLRLVLEQEGHRVKQAGNGAQVLEQYQRGHFDVLLLDVHMPEMDGLQAARWIRQHEKERQLKPVPIVALTASVMQEDRLAAQEAGMNGFANKPLDVPALFAEIARVIGVHSPETQVSATAVQEGPQLIDWTRAVALWGSRETVQREIHDFLSGCAESYPLGVEHDEKQLLFSLHGIRGAGGNLGLMAVSELAGELEQGLRAGKTMQLATSLQALQSLMEKTAVQAGVPEEETAPVEPAAAMDLQSLWRDIQALRQVLASHQLDDALLEGLLKQLRQGPVAVVKLAVELAEAVDDFEFDQALSLVDQLTEAWPELARVGEQNP